ncbi:MAG: 50S ribosomal protein L25 [Nitriliruptoraceae bacterium]
MADQIKLAVEPRTDLGKGATGRLRRTGRVPGIVYGYQVEPTPVHVDQLELYHALHTDAGTNALIRLELDGDTHLTVARDMQRHPVKGETQHVDFLAVNKDVRISVEVPVHLTDEDDTADDGGILNHILYTIPVLVKPLDVPNYLELSIADMEIGDVKRVEDLAGTLPAGAEFDIDTERTVVTMNAPMSEEALEALEEAAGVEGEEPELIGEEADEDAEGSEEPTEEGGHEDDED